MSGGAEPVHPISEADRPDPVRHRHLRTEADPVARPAALHIRRRAIAVHGRDRAVPVIRLLREAIRHHPLPAEAPVDRAAVPAVVPADKAAEDQEADNQQHNNVLLESPYSLYHTSRCADPQRLLYYSHASIGQT